ncbi:MAG: glycosyltransferase family 4 protein, partial [Planctomycetota bacterium]
MKVAIAIENLDLTRGGREISTAEIAVGLARRGVDVTILCQRASWTDEGVRVVALGRRGRGRAAGMRHFVDDLMKEDAFGRYDIVHAMLPVPGADIYQIRSGTIPALRAGSLRRRGGLRRVGSAIGWRLNSYRCCIAELERRVIADRTTTCLTVSKMVADEIAQFYGRRDGVHVVFNGVQAPGRGLDWHALRERRRRELGLGSDDLLLVVAAKNPYSKGVRETLNAFAQWRKTQAGPPFAKLAVVGCGGPRLYRQLAGRLGLDTTVMFVPHEHEIARWYAPADVCVQLSWYDPCSRVVLEATRVGLPSITTAFNGASEILHEGAGI